MENNTPSFRMFVNEKDAINFMTEKGGIIFIADGKYTKKLGGIEIDPFIDEK